jgi:hypothetical protein
MFAMASSGAAASDGRPAALSGVRYAQQSQQYQYPNQYPDQTRDEIYARVSDAQVRQIVNRIRTDAQTLRSALPAAPRGSYGSYSTDQRSNDLLYAVDDVRSAADQLLDQISRRQVSRGDVDTVLRRAASLDTLVQGSSYSRTTGWTRLDRDMTDLANAYGLPSDWRTGSYASGYGERYDRMTGTYRLNVARSDDPRRAADQILDQLPAAQRDQVSRRLFARLDPPDILAISRDNTRVTIASSRAPQMSFDADGRVRTEQGGPTGRRMTTQASFSGDRLEVTTKGSNGGDFSVTFEQLNNGQALRVTRRLFDDRLRQPVVVRSMYDKTSDTPDWDVYSGGNSGRSRNYSSGAYSSPAGDVFSQDSRLTATLDEPIAIRNVRQNDRVTLTVHNAIRADLDGATIEGIASPASNNGRNGLAIDLNQIRLRDGRTMPFDGVIESVRGPNGNDIPYNGETVQAGDRTQTEQAVQRGAIGAALGAVIGAIAGGGKGAAVGAVLGGGGGAATVFVDALNTNELPRGTEFTIRARTDRR